MKAVMMNKIAELLSKLQVALTPVWQRVKSFAQKQAHPTIIKSYEWCEPRAKSGFFAVIDWAKTFNKNDPEIEFYPAALEVLETPPSPAGRAVALVIMLFFLIALMWSIFGKVDIITTAQGKILPTERTKIIQPAETGVVRAINVRDGQQVKSGDVLIEIDSTISEAEKVRLHSEFVSMELTASLYRWSLK
jgi:hemolysin D